MTSIQDRIFFWLADRYKETLINKGSNSKEHKKMVKYLWKFYEHHKDYAQ